MGPTQSYGLVGGHLEVDGRKGVKELVAGATGRVYSTFMHQRMRLSDWPLIWDSGVCIAEHMRL